MIDRGTADVAWPGRGHHLLRRHARDKADEAAARDHVSSAVPISAKNLITLASSFCANWTSYLAAQWPVLRR
jgi:hypothetical protein